MTISPDKLAELAAAPCTQPWWNEMELRKGVRHLEGEAAFIAACSPDVILKLLAVVKAAQAMVACVDQPQWFDLRDAINALEAT